MGKLKRKRVKCWEDCLLPEYRIIAENGCWIWMGSHVANGYPIFRRNGKNIYVTRVSLENHIGKPLGDLFALHHCDNPPCFNPEHLYAGTQQDNMDDRSRRGRCGKQPKNKVPSRPAMVGSSGIRGIYWEKERNLWTVARSVNGRYIRHGSFKILADAITKNDEVNACLTPP